MPEFLVNHIGYLGIVLVLVLCGFGLPVPEEATVVLAGVLSSQGTLEPWPAWLACVIGAVLGDSVMYAIGYHWGHGLVRAHPRLGRFLHAEREPEFELLVERHALKVLFFCRFLVGVRAPVYLAAGVVRMPYRRFLMYDLICASVVVTTFFSISYAYGERIVRLIRNAEITLTIVLAVVVFCIGCWIYKRHYDRITYLLLGDPEAVAKDLPPEEVAADQRDLSDEHQSTEEKRVG